MRTVGKFDNLIDPDDEYNEHGLKPFQDKTHLNNTQPFVAEPFTPDDESEERERRDWEYGWQEGKKLGFLTLVDIPKERSNVTGFKHRINIFIFRCVCGKRVQLNYSNLYYRVRSGRLQHCGCQKDKDVKKPAGHPVLELMGSTIGTMEVLDFVQGSGWNCKCLKCGQRLVAAHSYKLVQTFAGHRCSFEGT